MCSVLLVLFRTWRCLLGRYRVICISTESLTSFLSLLREHHRLWDLHLSKGGPGALGLSGSGAGGLGSGRLHRCLGLALLRWAGRHHPQIWRRLLLRDGDIRRSDGVSEETAESSLDSVLSFLFIQKWNREMQPGVKKPRNQLAC